MRKRVGPELLAQLNDGWPHSLHRDLTVAELCEKARLDHLTPGHDLVTGPFRTKHRIVEPS